MDSLEGPLDTFKGFKECEFFFVFLLYSFPSCVNVEVRVADPQSDLRENPDPTLENKTSIRIRPLKSNTCNDLMVINC